MRDFEDTLFQHYVPSLECQLAHSVKNSEIHEHPVKYSSVSSQSIQKGYTTMIEKA